MDEQQTCTEEDGNPAAPGYRLCAECLAEQERRATEAEARADYLLEQRKDEDV